MELILGKIGLVAFAAYVYYKWGRGRPFSDAKDLKAAFNRKPGTPEGMRYVHNCTDCKPLEKLASLDIYVCFADMDHPTIVARHGDDPSDYTSSRMMSVVANNQLYDFVASDTGLQIVAREIEV